MVLEGEEEGNDEEPPPKKRLKISPVEVELAEEKKEGPAENGWIEGQKTLIRKSILRSTPGASSSSPCCKWPLVFDVSSPVDLTVTTPESIKIRKDQEEYRGLIARCRRVRIVEEFDKEAEDEVIDQEDEEETESAPPSDIFQTNYGGERMTWVRVDLMRTVDFENFVTEDFVLSKRTLVTKKFSVEIGHSFIDSATLNALVDTKNSIGAVGGGFEYEKAARKRIGCWENMHLLPRSVTKNDWANFKKLEKLDTATNWALTKNPQGGLFAFGEIHGDSRGFSKYILQKFKSSNLEIAESSCKGFSLEAPLIPLPLRADYTEGAGILFSSIVSSNKKAATALISNTASETKGNLLNIEVTDAYVKKILDGTEGKGVHLLVVDNEEAFHVPELVREVRFHKHLFCQVVVSLLAIREGGILVLKMFEAFTPFTVGLLFVLHRCFSHVSFHRLSDTEFSTERFCVCMGKRPQNGEVDEWTQFLLRVHGPATRVEEMKGQTQRSRSGSRTWGKRRRRRAPQEEWSNGVSELVPGAVMTSHADFFAVLRASNVETCKSVVEGVTRFVESEARLSDQNLYS